MAMTSDIKIMSKFGFGVKFYDRKVDLQRDVPFWDEQISSRMGAGLAMQSGSRQGSQSGTHPCLKAIQAIGQRTSDCLTADTTDGLVKPLAATPVRVLAAVDRAIFDFDFFDCLDFIEGAFLLNILGNMDAEIETIKSKEQFCEMNENYLPPIT
uniref:Uncharacterized protein n=1 Tax=Romanomermis culicivorax TaxID=13658 RepID=A0A915HFB5_ROMCU